MLFECKESECGGDPGRSSSGGGGNTSLAMYLYPQERITDSLSSTGGCAVSARIADQRYLAAEIPDKDSYFSVLTYVIKNPQSSSCAPLNGRTIAVVDILEARLASRRW